MQSKSYFRERKLPQMVCCLVKIIFFKKEDYLKPEIITKKENLHPSVPKTYTINCLFIVNHAVIPRVVKTTKCLKTLLKVAELGVIKLSHVL